MEQHSSSLKVAGSSQKYSATAPLSAFSSRTRHSTSASLASALWETTKRIQTAKPASGTPWSREEGRRKPLPSERSPFLAGSRADRCSATSASRSSWLCYKSRRWPPLCKSCKRATVTAAKGTLPSQHNFEWAKCALAAATLTLRRCFQAGWETSAALHRSPPPAGVRKTTSGADNWPLSETVPSCHAIAPAHLGDVVHEVHARLVGFGVRQLEKWGHPETDGVCSVATLNHTHAHVL